MTAANHASLPPDAEQFLRRLRAGLASLSAEERDDIVAEVRSHLVDRHTQGRSDLLAGFGSPSDYAARFLSEHALAAAVARGTSSALGRALLVGLPRTLTRLAVILLWSAQLLAVALILLGVTKLVAPACVGLFFDAQGRFVLFGFSTSPPSGAHDVLGWWAVPAFMVPGALTTWLVNRALRALAVRRLAHA